MIHDYSLAPSFTSKLDKDNYCDLFEWIGSHCIQHLETESNENITKIMQDVLRLMDSCKNRLHRPDTVEMKTSRCAVPIEMTSEVIKNCREMFKAAQKLVYQK